MKYQRMVITGLLAACWHAPALLAIGPVQGLPLKDGRPAVALVNGAPVYLDELVMAIGPSTNLARLRQGQGTAEDIALLDRLITIRLIAQEAGTMGLSEIPEIRKQVEVQSREILREVLIERLVRDVTPDKAAVERVFREAVREWKTDSVLFQDEAAARAARKEIAGGAAFADVVARAVAARTARTESDSSYHAKQDFLPQIAAAIAPLQVGQVTPVIRLQAGYVLIRVAGIRYPENAEARAAATEQILKQAQLKFLTDHEQVLRRNYVVVNKLVLSGLNYEATVPSIETLLADTRVVAEVKGGESVTVGDLTDYLQMQYFHDSGQPSQRRRMNAKKEDALDATLGRRLLNAEALRLGIDKSHDYRDRVRGFEESLVFDSFVQKVIAPTSKMTEAEVRRYYDGHLQEYSYPGMLKLRSLAFTRRAAAEDAVRKLREGTDFNWLAANAAGQAAKGTPGLLAFGGQLVMVSTMPDGLQKALAGVGSGETRLYASPEGPFYALAVDQAVASTPRPYAEVRQEVAQKAYAEKITSAVDEYAGKLRAQVTVETYLVRAR